MTSDAASPFAPRRPVDRLDECTFHHTMTLPGVGLVQGNFDLRHCLEAYLGRTRFSGKRVLEVGPASGFLTFSMEQQGADVVAVELPPGVPWDYVPYAPHLLQQWVPGQLDYMERLRNGFWFAHERFQSRSKVIYGDARELPESVGEFDVAVLAAVLLHNRDPLGFIQSCAKRTRARIVIADIYDPAVAQSGAAVMKFCPTESNQMIGTWWNISPALLREFLPILGFSETCFGVEELKFKPEPDSDEFEILPHYTITFDRD